MSRPVTDATAELIAMRASGDITAEEFAAARERLRSVEEPCAPGIEAPPSPAASALNPQPGERWGGLRAAPRPAAAEPKKKWGWGKKIVVACACLFAAVIWLGSNADAIVYSRTDYGAAWPYPPFEKATVRCKVQTFGSTDRPVATVELGGTVYALNGPALEHNQYPDPRPFGGTDKAAHASTTSQMISDALSKLCRWQQ